MKTEAQVGKRPYFTTRRLTTIALLGAISVVLTITPLGFIPIGILQVTLMHIPVIIAAILEGPGAGMFVGLIFGVSSFFMSFSTPSPMAPFFMNPLVSVLPRILIGLVSAYSYKGLKSLSDKVKALPEGKIESKHRLRKFFETCAVPLTAAIGTAFNTITVLFMIYLMAVLGVTVVAAEVMNNLILILLGITLTNGIPELIAATIITTAIVKGLSFIKK